MDIFVGYAGLAVSFVILASLMLWIFIKADNIPRKLKLLTIPIVLAYSIVLYSTVQNFLGHPTENAERMGQVIVLDVHVVEGDAIYFWVIDFNKRNVMAKFMPSPLTSMKQDAPMSVAIKYNTDLHKELMRMIMELALQKRGGLRADMEMLNRMSDFKGKKPFKLYDPKKVLTKELD